MIGLILLGALCALILAGMAAREFTAVRAGRDQVIDSVIGDEIGRGESAVARWDRSFRATRVGSRLERELVVAGVDRRPIEVFATAVGVSALSATVLWRFLAPVLGVVGLIMGLLVLRAYLRRERARRLEAFIAQMPELARVLANATNAGLSIHTAIGMAADELEEPARAELQRVSARLGFGASLDTALAEMSERLPSREVAVLTSTLLVSARAGGSLVTALRDIADTLEQRKEARREVRTTLAQALSTGYLVIGMGGLILVLLNVMWPGSVRTMTERPLGQAALLFAGLLFGGGLVAIRRMTRIEE